MKERTAIDLNGVVIFDRDITDEDLEIIPKDFRGDIVVHGDMSLCGKPYNIPCSLWVLGDINSLDSINVAGDFYCKGDIDSFNINVAGDFYCKGDIDSCDINVAGDFYHERTVYSGVIYVEGKIYAE